uniref:Uncharacterized protein n=1 Tax=Globodera rostochiensis TaxID=31243 RepID=A0A914GZC9_GLORO
MPSRPSVMLKLLLFTRVGLLLLAIELKDDEKKECNTAINPGPSTVILSQSLGRAEFRFPLFLGLFRFPAFYWCKICHADVYDVSLIKKCKCKHLSLFRKGGKAMMKRASTAAGVISAGAQRVNNGFIGRSDPDTLNAGAGQQLISVDTGRAGGGDLFEQQ